MNRQPIEHWGASAVRNIAVLGVFAVALLLPATTHAQSEFPNVTGFYRGFSLSDINPRLHPRMELRVDRQDGAAFFGIVEIGAPGGLPATFEGKLVDALGRFKGRAFGAFGEVRFEGAFQELGGLRSEGELVHASYRLIQATGRPDDTGKTTLLRSFAYPPDPCFPPDPCEPPDIAGSHEGTAESDLTGQAATFELQITIQAGTSFEGFEIVGGIAPCIIVGTIGVRGNFVYIGVGDAVRVLVGGQFGPPPDDGSQATYLRTFSTTAVDVGRFMVNRVR